jgi:hypothetical protein
MANELVAEKGNGKRQPACTCTGQACPTMCQIREYEHTLAASLGIWIYARSVLEQKKPDVVLFALNLKVNPTKRSIKYNLMPSKNIFQSIDCCIVGWKRNRRRYI